MSSTPSSTPTAALRNDPQALDELTGGAFSAPTAGERAARVRTWLLTEPSADQMQLVFRELSVKDKGAARLLREKLDEIKRMRDQETMAAEWAQKAQGLLDAPKLNVADAMAWQRDAAKAGAPLSREPLAGLKGLLAARIKAIEDLQHRVQVLREAAVLLAQRIEVLSTKSWQDAETVQASLGVDVQSWLQDVARLPDDAHWASVDARFPPQLEASRAQLALVWEAFSAALAQARLAAADAAASLPQVPVWAEELRQARGLPSETASAPRAKVDPQVQAHACSAVREVLEKLEKEVAQGHGKASTGAANALRQALKDHGRHIDVQLDRQAHAALAAAGELEGWQRWRADQLREELVAKAEALISRPEGQAIGGRKMQESLRALRDQWKQTDQGGVPNHALWKRFDDACNQAYKVVEAWLEKVRADAAEHKAARLALIAELQAWSAAADPNAPGHDWKAFNRELHQFAERWRAAGHLSEKAFAEMQPQWKAAMAAAAAPLEALQKQSLHRRQAMIDEAVALGAAPVLRIDAVKDLQQRWQAEAHAVPLDRRQEQKLWDAFRRPIDEAFNRKTAEREKAAASLGAFDRQVLEAARVLEAANASGDAQAIRAAMAALESALHAGGAAPAETASAQAGQVQAGGASEAPGDEVSVAVPVAAPRKPVVAVRGDDRPGMKKTEPAPPQGRGRASERPGARREDRPAPYPGRREAPRDTPRLGDAAFRAQREAQEHAQAALKKLAAQAHGEALTRLLSAWEQRDAASLPSVQELGGRVTPAVRALWAQALASPGATLDGTALLRLEIAAEVPTPAGELDARRALQLQLLTQRNDPAPAQTWGQDAARVLGSASNPEAARRLQQALKALLRR